MTSDTPLARLQALNWPQSTVDHPAPTPGDLWRAVWDNTAAVIAIVDQTDSRHQLAIPAAEPTAGDELSVSARTDGGLDYTLWTGLATEIPTFVLDYRIGRIELPEKVPTTGPWKVIDDPLDDRRLVRSKLEDDLGVLATAEWTSTSRTPGDLGELAQEQGLSASELATAAGISPGAARRVLQGQGTEAERQAAAAVLGAADPGASVEEDLAAVIDLPEFRSKIRSQADLGHGGDEVAARRQLAEQLTTRAARQRGGRATDWLTRTREFLRTLDDER